VAIIAREIVIRNSVECSIKSKKKPAADIIVPAIVGF
jgi:hypothetical protein